MGMEPGYQGCFFAGARASRIPLERGRSVVLGPRLVSSSKCFSENLDGDRGGFGSHHGSPLIVGRFTRDALVRTRKMGLGHAGLLLRPSSLASQVSLVTSPSLVDDLWVPEQLVEEANQNGIGDSGVAGDELRSHRHDPQRVGRRR